MIVRDLAALTIGALLAFCGGSVAQAEDASVPLPLPVIPTAFTHHRLTLANDLRLAYTAPAGRIVITDKQCRPAASNRYVRVNYGEIAPAWSYQRDATDVGLGQVTLPKVLPGLAPALTRNPTLRVLSANGYFDLATPFFGTEKDPHHLGLDPALRMIYLEPASRRALRDDIESFIQSATGK